MPAIITRDQYGVFPEWTSYPEIPLNTPAWECTEYGEIYDAAPFIGENRAIPGVPGRLAMNREADQWAFTLRVTVFGQYDLEGNAYTDARVGVRSNLRFLRTNLFRPSGVRPFEFYDLDGTGEDGDVQVVPPFQPVFAGPAAARLLLNVLVPASELDVIFSSS